MLSTARIPADLQVHRIWEPMRESDDRDPILYVTERRRRFIGAAAIGAGLVEWLVIFLFHLYIPLLVVGFLATLAGGVYASGGRAGFYELNRDGSLGAYLGRTRPDLDSMRSRRP